MYSVACPGSMPLKGLWHGHCTVTNTLGCELPPTVSHQRPDWDEQCLTSLIAMIHSYSESASISSLSDVGLDLGEIVTQLWSEWSVRRIIYFP